jgi:hypothetical protein
MNSATDANTDCLNCLTSVLMVIVQRRKHFTSFLASIGMAAPVNRFVTSLPQTEKLAARYERTMARLEQITRAGYQVKVQWECEFDNAGIATPELLAHTTVCKSPLCTRVEPTPCVYTIRPGKARLFSM